MLSKRLQAVYECIKTDLIVADIGTDHAYLPCALIQKGKSKFCYACDILEGPLKQAEKNILAYNLQDKIKTILSDGLENIPSDCNAIVIAGMGWQSAKQIMEKNITRLGRFEQIIVQVNREVSSFRKWISQHHFTILDERFLFDIHAYQIIVFNIQFHEQYNDFELEFGPILIKQRSIAFLEYYQYHQKYLQEILDQCEDKTKVTLLSEKVEMIRFLLNYRSI